MSRVSKLKYATALALVTICHAADRFDHEINCLDALGAEISGEIFVDGKARRLFDPSGRLSLGFRFAKVSGTETIIAGVGTLQTRWRPKKVIPGRPGPKVSSTDPTHEVPAFVMYVLDASGGEAQKFSPNRDIYPDQYPDALAVMPEVPNGNAAYVTQSAEARGPRGSRVQVSARAVKGPESGFAVENVSLTVINEGELQISEPAPVKFGDQKWYLRPRHAREGVRLMLGHISLIVQDWIRNVNGEAQTSKNQALRQELLSRAKGEACQPLMASDEKETKETLEAAIMWLQGLP